MKYKILPQSLGHRSGANRNDIYQMLAYLTATDLSEGVLIYAGAEAVDETITVRQAGTKIHIVSLDLSADHARALLAEKMQRLPGVLDRLASGQPTVLI